jgi:diaminopimelate decarboxylase
MEIYISGLYSGTNPQPGIGIARSLRQAYPNAKLVGVEYSNRCSGIHWQDFDEIWLQRPWDEIDLDHHAREVRKVIDGGALWISSIDLEILWFANIFPEGHPNLLTPPRPALEGTAKPAIPAHGDLPVSVPTFVTTSELSDWEIHHFCRENDWRVWLKGPYYEAVRISSWPGFLDGRHILSEAWATDDLFLQKHVAGYEESVMLAAYKGELLDCVSMRKRDLTEMSKTWAGDVTEVPEDMVTALRTFIRKTNWTGGAELEMVRDGMGKLWILEVNPRFPAWVHGSTITGRNMPAALVEGATGVPAQEAVSRAKEFTRVVLEIPVLDKFPLSPLPEPLGHRIGHSLKHPSGLLEFANRLHKLDNDAMSQEARDRKPQGAPEVPASFAEDLSGMSFEGMQTPSSLFLEGTAAEGFSTAAQLARRVSTDHISVHNGYSIKTNPDERLIKLAHEMGFFAEAISLHEAKKALDCGFRPDQVILNGPAKWWQEEVYPESTFHAIFCDSLEELDAVTHRVERGDIRTEFLGVRLRTPNMGSRFGISVDTPEDLGKLVDGVKRIPREVNFGIHFHMASSNIGVGEWWHLFHAMLRWCSSVEALSGRPVELLDIGGGWFPEDIARGDAERLRQAVEKVPDFLPHVQRIFCEPGKALAQPSMAVAMQILEIRNADSDAPEAVMDGSIAELPMYFFHPHRILHADDTGEFKPLNRGKTKLLGRLCMEHDIVASNVELPKTAKAGDVLVFCDAGAYDRSMSYVFGRG